ncbi:adenylyltransferase/cytidyltransferase family protein, partial [Prochlorococcus sp. AH-736-K20]
MYSSNFFAWCRMRYCFDIDGTIFNTPKDKFNKPDYKNSSPIKFMINQVNKLYDQGHYIILQTARGKSSGIDWTNLTREQLNKFGCKYHELFPMFTKPTADLFIDDKAINVEDWVRSHCPQKKGIIAGAFDIIHPGYVRMFKEAKQFCNHLTIALHEDPTLERSNKLKPIQSVEERKEILLSIKYIDDIQIYKLEKTFLEMLKDFDVRFLGDDY